MNNCVFVGRLGRDSELKNVNDSSLLVFNVASDVGYGDKKIPFGLNVICGAKELKHCISI